jgi:hypothetical protein
MFLLKSKQLFLIFIVLSFFLISCENKPKVPTKMNLETINNVGVPASTYLEVEGMPSYYLMIYSYTYYKDNPQQKTIDNIYYPIMSKEQYDKYSKSIVKNKDGSLYLDTKKAKSLGLTFRIFVRHKDTSESFVKHPSEEKWTTYRGIAQSGDKINQKAGELMKNDPEIAPLLAPKNIVVIYME